MESSIAPAQHRVKEWLRANKKFLPKTGMEPDTSFRPQGQDDIQCHCKQLENLQKDLVEVSRYKSMILFQLPRLSFIQPAKKIALNSASE